ncbi:MAG: hypothetical protein LBU32_15860 [Clostridiales bacterium]|jgi:tagaturonate reductase|nr:hypothetical protein [Clostridiales bacterium]
MLSRTDSAWKLPDAFRSWLTECNVFCGTLVDRIVTGYPKDEAGTLEKKCGYTGRLLVAGDPFALWVIECENPGSVGKEFPLDKTSLPVIFKKNLRPYQERKVRLSNGAHTASVFAAYLTELTTVGEMMNDKTMSAFFAESRIRRTCPNGSPAGGRVRQFADSEMERSENHFIKHNLLSIALNSISKYKARMLPTILETQAKTGSLPKFLCFSLAAPMSFYSGELNSENKLIAVRGDIPYGILDDTPELLFFVENNKQPANEFTEAFLGRIDFWGRDLTQIPGLSKSVAGALQSIRETGMADAVRALL